VEEERDDVFAAIASCFSKSHASIIINDIRMCGQDLNSWIVPVSGSGDELFSWSSSGGGGESKEGEGGEEELEKHGG
jgi:hypothetical protein